jgi:hypothetical protein
MQKKKNISNKPQTANVSLLQSNSRHFISWMPVHSKMCTTSFADGFPKTTRRRVCSVVLTEKVPTGYPYSALAIRMATPSNPHHLTSISIQSEHALAVARGEYLAIKKNLQAMFCIIAKQTQTICIVCTVHLSTTQAQLHIYVQTNYPLCLCAVSYISKWFQPLDLLS